MRINVIRLWGQAGRCVILLIVVCLLSCNLKKEETPALPPVTSPLSQPHIGFGVINVSYTNVNAGPGESGNVPGYLRRGSVVTIHERRQVKTGGKTESWLLVEGSYKGWLRETHVDVYENESKAQTASEAMKR